jgi:hypothetical protein
LSHGSVDGFRSDKASSMTVVLSRPPMAVRSAAQLPSLQILFDVSLPGTNSYRAGHLPTSASKVSAKNWR